MVIYRRGNVIDKVLIIFKSVNTVSHFSRKGFKTLGIAIEVGSKYEHDKDTNSGKLTLVKIK